MLIELLDEIPDLVVELIYATEENFTGRRVYPDEARAYLCPPAAERLKKVQASLRELGLSLKIWDAYRPLSVQRKFWELVPDPRYVADPAEGSRHNRGMAVDLTLIDASGKELSMPTPFDDFSERASHSYLDCSAEQIANRTLLKEAMMAQGFRPIDTEWWHYDASGWEDCPILDLTFDELKAT
jgi:D-alanyl-D-alanine dipeptidase